MKGPTIQDILSRWFEFSGYDPDQHKFNLLSSEYDYHKAGDRITELLRDYEPSGALAVMYAKQKFINSMKESRVNLWNVLSEPEKLKPYQEAYADFHSPVVMEGEQMISDNITKLIEKISGKPMLGDRDMEKEKSVIAESVETVVDNIQKLHYDVYRKGGKVELVHKFPSQIFVFPTLAQCVLSLDNANYYAIPAELYFQVKDKIPPDIGILLYYDGPNYHGIRKKKEAKLKQLSSEQQKWLILSASKRNIKCLTEKVRDLEQHILETEIPCW